jgi:hypothetical protein
LKAHPSNQIHSNPPLLLRHFYHFLIPAEDSNKKFGDILNQKRGKKEANFGLVLKLPPPIFGPKFLSQKYPLNIIHCCSLSPPHIFSISPHLFMEFAQPPLVWPHSSPALMNFNAFFPPPILQK